MVVDLAKTAPEESGANEVNYEASPTFARFHNDPSFFRGIRGPWGSGKTTGCCWDIWIRAHQMHPCKDGVRRSRWVAIRNTYAELKSTTIQSWSAWFGPENGPGFGSIVYDSPIRQVIRLDYLDHPVEIEMWFVAMDRPDQVKKLKSMEVTGGWMNEASELPVEVLEYLTPRVGRYPHPKDMPRSYPVGRDWPSWSGIIADTNSMDHDHWWYELAELKRPKGYRFYDQPSGLSPDAENIKFLPGGANYYYRLMEGKDDQWIKVYVHNQYGATKKGSPIYPEYNDAVHVSKEPLEVYRALPLYIGFDFGLTPACLICQISPRGQLRVLREIVTPKGETMGIVRFCEELVLPILNNHYAGMDWRAKGDPGGNIRSQTDERTCIDDLNYLGIPAEATSTNRYNPRREALAFYMTRMIDGKPCFLIDPTNAPNFRKGLNGEYRWREVRRIGGSTELTGEPDKNDYSHIVEAGQYAVQDQVLGLKMDLAVSKQAIEAPAPPPRRTYGY